MRKLELKDICGYFESESTLFYFEDKIIDGSFGWAINKLNDVNNKIILRPISDLYKTITHNGKEIVPIVELAKMVKKGQWELGNKGALLEIDKDIWVFEFYDNAFNLSRDWNARWTHSQYQLFDYLHELKIDYRGLIDAGLAVSVYDLEINPYN